MDSLCGTLSFPAGTTFSMALSSFVPNPSGTGGTINILLNGQIVATWNAIDSNGTIVPNGYYHFVIEEHSTDGNTVFLERDAFIAPNNNQLVDLVAMPNVGHPGDIIRFAASFAGTAADGQSKIRIYAVSGELVQTLQISNGTSSWNLVNSNYQTVASGVYIVVLDGLNPLNGQKCSKTVKVLVTH